MPRDSVSLGPGTPVSVCVGPGAFRMRPLDHETDMHSLDPGPRSLKLAHVFSQCGEQPSLLRVATRGAEAAGPEPDDAAASLRVLQAIPRPVGPAIAHRPLPRQHAS